MGRQASRSRKTTETDIQLSIDLDGNGKSRVDTGVPFMDHMLTLFARHGFFALDVTARGDLGVDAHHLLEDLGLVLGETIREALGDKCGIRRYGFFVLPMDETLVRVVLDLSGRPCLVFNVPCPVDEVGGVGARLFHEFFQALVNTLGMNLHVDLIRGEEAHHIFEGVFKAFARALDMAVQQDPRETGVPSTKGSLA